MAERKKRNIIMGALCAVVLLMGVGYAAFQTVLNINGTSNITSNWNVKIESITSKNIVGSASNNGEPIFDGLNATFKTNFVSPGDSINYEITITNAGNINAKLSKIILNDTNNSAIKFTTQGVSEGDILMTGETSVLSVRSEYLSTVTGQPVNTNSNLKVTLEYVQAGTDEEGNLAPTETITIGGLDVETTTYGDGLYEDAYEAGRYVYRGTNPNNYITFNGELWRIISKEVEGTYEIIKEEKLLTTMPFDAADSRIAPYCTHPTYGCNIWGSKSSMYNLSGSNLSQLQYKIAGASYELPFEEASLNTYLNTEYYNNLQTSSKNHIVSHLFKVGLISTNNSSFNIDLSQEKTSFWKGKIGLLSPTDYIKASTNKNCTNITQSYQNTDYYCKEDNYLHKSTYHWWTLSPASANGAYGGWYINKQGYLDTNRVITGSAATRPAIYLTKDIVLSGGGTISNPYIVN